MNVSKITNITSGGIKGMDAVYNYFKDRDEKKLLEEIKKGIIKRTEHGEYLYDTLCFARDQLRQAGLDSKYYYCDRTKEEYNKSVAKTFDDLNLNMWEKVIDTFEVHDRCNSEQTTIFLYKYPEKKFSIDDSIDFGKKEIPVENIELAYKDVEKLAKAGYGDDLFIDSVMFKDRVDSIPHWPRSSWHILPSGKLYAEYFYFRKFDKNHYQKNSSIIIKDLEEKLKKTNNPEEQKEIKDTIELLHEKEREYPEELEPGFVDKYLKAWKEEMLKVNKLGLDRYRYEKYGRTH